MTTAIGRPTTGATDTENWRAYAACAEVDIDLHFPTPHTNGWKKQTKRAKAICGGCPVRETCLTWALDTRQPAGIWGGMSERERRRLLGIQQSQTQLCLDRQVWIEQQVAANVSQREIARRLGVERATLSRALARFEAERVAGEVEAA